MPDFTWGTLDGDFTLSEAWTGCDALVHAIEALTVPHWLGARYDDLGLRRFFAGLQLDEIAQLRGVSRRSIDRTWAFAKAWLYREMRIS